MLRLSRVLLLLAALMVATTPMATAAPFVTTTVSQATFVTENLLFLQVCRPELGLYTVTRDVTTVAHITAAGSEELEPGEGPELIPPYHLVAVTTGTIVAVPENPAEPTFTGTIVVRQVEHDLEPGQIITSNSRRVLHGSDGSKVTVEAIFHLTLTPSGEVAVTFGEGGCSTT
jgi:hypothetical protein